MEKAFSLSSATIWQFKDKLPTPKNSPLNSQIDQFNLTKGPLLVFFCNVVLVEKQKNENPHGVEMSPKLSSLILCIGDEKAASSQLSSSRHRLSITESCVETQREAFLTPRSSEELLSVNSVNDGFQKKSFPPHWYPCCLVSANSGSDKWYLRVIFLWD